MNEHTQHKTYAMTQEELDAMIVKALRVHEEMSPRLTVSQVDAIVQDSVSRILTRLGMDHTNPLEIQQDFARLREWRQASEQLKSKTMLVILSVFVAGLLSVIWVGFRIMVGKVE